VVPLSAEQWHRTSPLAAVFFLGRIYRTIAQNAVQSLAPLVAFLFAYEGDLGKKLVLGVGTFILVTIIIAGLRYWFFLYQLTDRSIRIRDGILRRTQTDIKYERLQGLTTEQSLLYRLFGLVTVKLDTAGSARQEAYLPAVGRPLAEELRRLSHAGSAGPSRAVEEDSEDAEPASSASAWRALLQLDARDMVRIGLSSGRVLVVLALLAPFLERWAEYAEENLSGDELARAAGNFAQWGLAGGMLLGLAIAIGVAIVLVILSILGAFIRFHRYTLEGDGTSLRSTAGLFTRYEHALRCDKVQVLAATQNPMLRLFDRYRARMQRASSNRREGRRSLAIPLCTHAQLSGVSAEVFGDEFPDAVLDPGSPRFVRISPRWIRSRTMLFGLLPSAFAAALLMPVVGPGALWLLAWSPVVAMVAWQRYRKIGVFVAANGMVLRDGFVGWRLRAFLNRKIQRVSIVQTPTQMRRQLATMRIYLASGSVRIPYLPIADASRLRDYLLYKVESSDLAWH